MKKKISFTYNNFEFQRINIYKSYSMSLWSIGFSAGYNEIKLFSFAEILPIFFRLHQVLNRLQLLNPRLNHIHDSFIIKRNLFVILCSHLVISSSKTYCHLSKRKEFYFTNPVNPDRKSVAPSWVHQDKDNFDYPPIKTKFL